MGSGCAMRENVTRTFSLIAHPDPFKPVWRDQL